jgi:hypothetical protein
MWLTARSPLSVKRVPCGYSPLSSTATPGIASPACLSTSRVTIASWMAFHSAHQPHRGGDLRETPASILGLLRQQPAASPAPSPASPPVSPTTRPPPSPAAAALARASKRNPLAVERQLAVSARHHPSVRVNVPHPAMPCCVAGVPLAAESGSSDGRRHKLPLRHPPTAPHPSIPSHGLRVLSPRVCSGTVERAERSPRGDASLTTTTEDG